MVHRLDSPIIGIEDLIFQILEKVGDVEEWKAKIEQLDRADDLERLAKMKGLTDQMAMTAHQINPRVAYPFDGNWLLPVDLC
jgi:hypothetical protein